MAKYQFSFGRLHLILMEGMPLQLSEVMNKTRYSKSLLVQMELTPAKGNGS